MQDIRTKQTSAGVTLIELLVVIVIAGIFALIGAPAFTTYINNTTQATTMTQLVSDLNRARSEAIKRNRRVVVCGRATDTTCGNSTNWQNGWLVCYDEDDDNACDAETATDPNPIVIHAPLKSTLTLTALAASIHFNPSGTQGAAGTTTLTLSGNWTGATNRVASIAATGNISQTP